MVKKISKVLFEKTAQMKIQQMAFMLMAITLFFVLAGLFFVMFQSGGLKEKATELQEKNALLLVTRLANSPEFSCGEVYDGRKVNCVDGDKVMIVKQRISDYENFWDIENVEIRKVGYPNEEILCTNRNYPECNIIRLRDEETSGFDISNYVSLCRKDSFGGDIYSKCELAIISVKYEKVE